MREDRRGVVVNSSGISAHQDVAASWTLLVARTPRADPEISAVLAFVRSGWLEAHAVFNPYCEDCPSLAWATRVYRNLWSHYSELGCEE